MQTYTKAALARISGISVDQLKKWDQAGLLQPARVSRGRFTERRYTREQAIGVLALAEFKRGGVSGRLIRAASAKLPASLSEYAYVVFDGRAVTPKSTDAEVIELLSQKPGARLLRVSELADRLL